MKKLLFLLLALSFNTSNAEIRQVNYPGFTLWLDCNQHGAIQFQYHITKDIGNLPRVEKFSLDPSVPASCQPSSAAAYGNGYDRGHLVPANHMDFSQAAITASNYMTNVLPQTANMNRGAWLATEELIECYRDIEDLNVIGGVIWGNNSADDYFVKSHNVKTPDAYWKVVIRGSGHYEQSIAWIVPNTKDAVRNKVDQYIVSVSTLEKITGITIPVQDKVSKPAKTWITPIGCHKG